MALDYPRTGSLHGALAIDYHCFRQAKQANLKGSFRGLLSPKSNKASGSINKSTQVGRNLESVVQYQDRHLPVVNLKVNWIKIRLHTVLLST